MQIGVHLELESGSATLDLWDYKKTFAEEEQLRFHQI